MYPPIFPTIKASAAVRALIGSDPTRFYQFGMAPQNVTKPYAVWTRVFGRPENYLGQVPDIDALTIQIDCYASSADQSRTVAVAIRDAIETACYITSWLGESRDPETGNYRVGMQSDWLVER